MIKPNITTICIMFLFIISSNKNIKLITDNTILNFRSHHKKIGTKFFHFTALIGIYYGINNIVSKYNLNNYLNLYHCLVLLLSRKLFIVQSLLYNSIKFIPKTSFEKSFLIILVSYLITDLSHFIFNESTYSSSYKNKKNMTFIKQKFEHNFYLPSLILDSILSYEPKLIRGYASFPHSLEEEVENANKKFINKKIPKYYLNEINPVVDNIISSFLSNNKNLKSKRVINIDELYFTNNSMDNISESDYVVDNYHIDGFFPNIGINTYRLLITYQQSENDNSKTDFILENCKTKNTNYVIFDFNSQVHRAMLDKNSKTPRVLLKFHFITYNKNIPLFIVNNYIRLLEKFYIKMRKDKNVHRSISSIKTDLLRPVDMTYNL